MLKSIGAPTLLILIWSTGFIAARAVAPHADANLFLTFRFLLALAGFAFLARGVQWPKGGQFLGHVLAGMMMNGVYLGASWWAVTHGLAAGVMALMGALQPLFTAVIVALVLRGPITYRTKGGLVVGFAGVGLVLSPRLAGVGSEGLPALPIMLGLLSIIALTVGTMVQKSSLAAADLRAAGAVRVRFECRLGMDGHRAPALADGRSPAPALQYHHGNPSSRIALSGIATLSLGRLSQKS